MTFPPSCLSKLREGDFARGPAMTRGHFQGVIHHLRGTVAGRGLPTLPDAELLERFVRRRDGAAFELLVWRHGKMVFNVCRRLLRDPRDAEDAFQATFLALARHAGSIRAREAVANSTITAPRGCLAVQACNEPHSSP